MASYNAQREMYLPKVLLLLKEGMGSENISKIVPVSRETVRRWKIKFAPEMNIPVAMKTNKPQSSETSSIDYDENDVKALQKRVKELEAQLLKAEIKAEFYNEMINVAEAKFKIPIRKKAGAKQ